MELEDEADIDIAETRQRLLAERFETGALVADRPAVGALERPHDLKQSRLSGTAGPGHGNDFAAPDVEADAVENAKLVVALDNISDFNHSAKLRKNPNDSKVSSSNSVCEFHFPFLWHFIFLFCEFHFPFLWHFVFLFCGISFSFFVVKRPSDTILRSGQRRLMAADGKGDDDVRSGETPDEVAAASFSHAVGTDSNLGNRKVVDSGSFENSLLGHPAHMGIERHLPLALSQNPLYYARYARRRRFGVDTEGIVGAEGNDSFFARMADRDEHSVEVRGTLSVVGQRPEAVTAEQHTDGLDLRRGQRELYQCCRLSSEGIDSVNKVVADGFESGCQRVGRSGCSRSFEEKRSADNAVAARRSGKYLKGGCRA